MMTVYTKATGKSEYFPNFSVYNTDIFTVLAQYMGPRPRGAVKPFHDHRFTHYNVTDYRGSILDDTPSTQTTRTGWIQSITVPEATYPTVDWGALRNRALGRLFSEVRGGVDLTVSAAEWKQTSRMLKDNAGKALLFDSYGDQYGNIVKQNQRKVGGNAYTNRHLSNETQRLVKAMERRVTRLSVFLSHFKTPKDWANRWLETKYGWMPLVKDIYETGQQLIDLHKYTYVRVVGRARETNVAIIERPKPGLSGVVERTYVSDVFRHKIVAEFALRNSVIQSLSGYSSLNPASILWETLPYSFVVDWVVDVGGYLRNLESALLFGHDLKKCYSVRGSLRDLESSLYGACYYAAGSVIVYDAKAEGRWTEKYRYLDGILPSVPTVHARLGWQRLISAASLLSQFIGKGK